jgi:hypothetical protein
MKIVVPESLDNSAVSARELSILVPNLQTRFLLSERYDAKPAR